MSETFSLLHPCLILPNCPVIKAYVFLVRLKSIQPVIMRLVSYKKTRDDSNLPLFGACCGHQEGTIMQIRGRVKANSQNRIQTQCF